jgi:transforming growth factor-beta-induced protein
MRRRLLAPLLAGLMVTGLIAGPVSAVAPQPTIADIAVGNGNFTTLVAALTCTDLVGAVADPAADLTVFAPTDAAFAKLGLNARNVCWLPRSILSNILLYHVAPEERFANEVVASSGIPTLNGGSLYPSVRNGNAYLNLYARISTTDIDASNGVIHVIDWVLVPLRLI